MASALDHREFLASLSQEDRVRLTETDNQAGLRRLAVHGGTIIFLATWVGVGAPLWPIALIPLGLSLIFLFMLVHETTHRTPFSNPRLNDAVGRFCGALIILPFTWFRAFHLAHHRFTNDPDLDPELATPRPRTWSQYLIYISGLAYWGAMARKIALSAIGQIEDDFVTNSNRHRICREGRFLLGFYLLASASFLWTDLLFWIWLLPLLIGQPFLRLYLLAEHGRCAPVADMFENTRTTFTGALIRYFAWNMPYHAEHHAMPSVPFHKLPELHQLTSPHLKVTERGYGRFNIRYFLDVIAKARA